ncbi:MAG: hypothetical protein MJE66_22650 [Proteobacteria bacterium]|nr:hypothetical protein [Pseudomonadota bacterium]
MGLDLRTRDRWQTIAWVGLLTLVAVPSQAVDVGQCPTPNPGGFPFSKRFVESRTSYRINAASFDELPDVSRDAGAVAVIMGADAWNEQTTAADFRFLGTTSRTSLPLAIEECKARGVDGSLVTVSTACLTGGYARMLGRCWRANDGWSQFEMIIHTRWRPTRNDACEPIPWSVGLAQSGRLDLASVTTHEFGHALDIGHIPNEYAGVMNAVGVYGTNRRRDLYLADIECAEVNAGARELRARYRLHVRGDLRNERTFLDAGASTPQAAVGVSRDPNGVWRWVAAFKLYGFGSYYWNWGLGSQNEVFVLNEPSGLGLTVGTTHEAPEWARLFWPRRDEYIRHDWRSRHAVMYRFSDDGFATYGPTGLVAYCNDMSGWMQCARTRFGYDVSFVHTAKAVSMTWDDANQRTVFAWVHQDRDFAPNSQNRQVRVAFGYIGHIQGGWMLPAADEFGVRSSVSPGVACSAGRAGGYDCILAYVDDADPMASVRIKRFRGRPGAERVELEAEPGWRRLLGNVGTTSRIAAWYHSNNFYVAIRPTRRGQQLEVFRSPDGRNWTVVVGSWTGPYITTGPTAASTWTRGNNVLMYLRE